MNRREAIAALVALPSVANIRTANLAPNDVIVIECEGHITQANAVFIKSQIERIWPGRKCLVMDASLRMKVGRE